jgi:hypothetical protein
MKLVVAVLVALVPLACDTPDAPTGKAAPSASASVSASTSSAASVPPAAPGVSAAVVDPASPGPTKDTVVPVFDPTKEPKRTVNALAGGTLALYLPEWAGTAWKLTQPNNSLGKAKEETIPGFAGPTPAHAFTWQIKDALKGQTFVVPLTNTAKAGAISKTFTLTINVS